MEGEKARSPESSGTHGWLRVLRKQTGEYSYYYTNMKNNL